MRVEEKGGGGGGWVYHVREISCTLYAQTSSCDFKIINGDCVILISL